MKQPGGALRNLLHRANKEVRNNVSCSLTEHRIELRGDAIEGYHHDCFFKHAVRDFVLQGYGFIFGGTVGGTLLFMM